MRLRPSISLAFAHGFSPTMMGAIGLTFLLSLGACTTAHEIDDEGTDDSAVTVDTRSPASRRQYDANVAFANEYVARCKRSSDGRPRVLVTGFGRFMSIADNATGRIVSTLVPEAAYPETAAPKEPGAVDPPEPQLSVGMTTLDIDGIGPVDVCGMILPVYWDLAAILIAKEASDFEPSLVIMNGVAAERQPLWIELGATNRAQPSDDGSNQLRPAVVPGEAWAKIIDGASEAEESRGNLLSWAHVERAARAAIAEHAEDTERGIRFGDVLPETLLAGFPRPSNTYLCNNVTYVTGWLMSHPGRRARLLRANPKLPDAINEVHVSMTTDLREVPRVFMHWPSLLADVHHRAGADVLAAVIGAQLRASQAFRNGDASAAATVGDNALADPSLAGGAFF